MVTTHKHSQTYAHQTLQTYNKQQIELSYTNVDVSYVSSRFETPTDVWGLLWSQPQQISAQTLYYQDLECLGYISATDIMGLSSFNLCGGLRKTHVYCIMHQSA